MNAIVQVPANFGRVSTIFANQVPSDELGSGIVTGFGVVGYRGKVWSIKHQGQEHQLMRDDGDGPRGSIEVVLVKASSVVSKIFYAAGFQDGSTAPPDCWSSNGQTPDASVQRKQSPTCANCPNNAWGSRVTESGKNGKACSDAKRIAVVPLGDIDNETFGGPMLLRVPAASLKDVKQYGDLMGSYGFPYFAVGTRIAFDPQDAYPHFVFSAIRPLTDEEGKKVLALRDDPKVARILSEMVETAAPGAAPAQAAPPASPFEQPPQATQQAAQQPAQQPTQQPMQQAQPTQAAPLQPAMGTAPAPMPAAVTQPAAPAATPRTTTRQPRQPRAQAQPAGAPVQAGGFVTVTPQVTQPAPQPVSQPPVAAAPQVAQPAPAPEQAAAGAAEFDDMLDSLLDA